ncbi:MAG TPA: alpha/beta fold hydrolase [Vicinamibacterales bacterium]|jgi:phospholipase/carboxylesterase
MTTRRRFVANAASTLAALAVGRSCFGGANRRQRSEGRLAARPRANADTSLASGPLGLGDGRRDGVIQMPSTPVSGTVPLLVFLHGATQSGAALLRRIGPAADQAGMAVLAPDSRGTTWDAIADDFGDDVTFLNRALEFVFARLTVDPSRVAIGGFSDGASYALSLGLANGDLFPRVVACSPGFVIQAPAAGRPRVFISHGTHDQILPIDQCSRVIVPRLRSRGYDVTYREFDGRHELPPEIAGDAMRWVIS